MIKNSPGKWWLLTLLALLLSACANVPLENFDDPNAEPATIWVAQTFTGGRQCREDAYSPPNVNEVLGAIGVEVLATHIDFLPICRACDICPDYAAEHYAQIFEHQLSLAESAGFVQSEGPAQP